MTPDPEAEILLCCARVRQDSSSAERLRRLVRRELDWRRLFRLARLHGMIPLVYRHCRAIDCKGVPAAILDRLRAGAHGIAMRNFCMAQELLKLLKSLHAEGIDAVPFKGPTLAVAAYGDLGLRHFNDIDLLIRPHQMATAKQILEGQRYRLHFRLTPSQEKMYLQSVGQLPFLGDDGSCLVELHSKLMPRGFYFPLEQETLWDRLRPVFVCGTETTTLCAEDSLLLLCAHGAKHLWTSLGWICDVAELVRSHAGMNWDLVSHRARVLRSRRMVSMGLLLARELLQAPAPAAVRGELRPDCTARALAARVCQRLFHERDGPPGGLTSSLFHLRVRESLNDGIRYGLHLALRPARADWSLFSTSPAFSPVYFVVRPIRLAAKYGRLLLST